MTCSQLSRITTASARLSRSNSAASPPVTFSAAITVSRTSSAVCAASSRTSQTPPGTPDSARPVAIATAVLPMPPGPTTSTSRPPSSSVGQDGDLLVASDQLRRQRRQVPGLGGRRAECRVVVEDPPLELLQRRSGFEAELVGEPGADPLVRGQRVGLAARPVQRGDQQLPQPFLVGVARDGGLQLADHGVSELQPCRELGLDERPRAPLRAAPGAERPSRRSRATPLRGSAAVPPRSSRRRRDHRPRRAAERRRRWRGARESASTASGSTASL